MTTFRILVVDDQTSVRVYFRKLLAPLQAEVVEAADGREALELAGRDRFDVVISDFDMPRLNGLELCRRLKKDPRTQAIPVIMVSTFDSDADIDRGFQAGAAHYLSKTKIEEHLLGTVREILTRSRFQQEKLIMVVDDSKVVRDLVASGLRESGFRVVTVQNGREALKLLAGERPDLVLCDISMPEMDGYELCRALQADPGLRDIPFVVMSKYADRGHMRRMVQCGAVSYLVKPFNLEQLIIQVEKLLSDQYLLLLKEKERLDGERQMLLAGITSLISALEFRDVYTRGHSEAVSRIMTGMMKFSGAHRYDVEMGALGGRLHDIGKIGIRDEVLLKPGPLTAAEYAHIKTHPVIGADILSSIPSLAQVIPIVLHHHERMDGKGYPHGLRNEAIPAWARMAAVADTFNALTSNRAYRRAMDREQALQILMEARGTQLCPDHVDLFLQWIDSPEGREHEEAAPKAAVPLPGLRN